MRIFAKGQETFLYINGLGVNRRVNLGNNIELLPATVNVDLGTIAELSSNQGDYGVSLIFLWLVKCQMHIISDNPKNLARDAWNSLWDIVLLSALFNCDAVCNFQSEKPVEQLSSNSDFRVTNHHLRGLTAPMYNLTDEDITWIENYFALGRKLLDLPKFQNAVHCLATYHWHSLPKAQLALIWSGIEGLFEIHEELVFRLSLYISRFLDADDVEKMRVTYKSVHNLYKERSAAVHGSREIWKPQESVDDSANLLKRLIYSCIAQNKLPNIDELAP